MPHRFVSWLLPFLLAVPGLGGAEFLPADAAFRLETRDNGGELRLTWTIAPGYYLYRQRVEVKADPPGDLAVPMLPPGIPHTDETYGDSEIYRSQLDIAVPVGSATGVTVGWQGCADAGLCYPPQTRRVALQGAGAAAAAAVATAGEPVAAAPPSLAEDQGIARGLASGSMTWTVLAFLGLGLLMTFTPCVLPMVPIVSGMVVGAGAGPRRGFVLALAYVLPMASTYAALGVAAALAGANLQAMLQQPWVIASTSTLFVALALAMFGFFELQLPAAVRDRLHSAGVSRRGGSLAGAAVLGTVSAVMVGPCMTAPLAGALLYIADSGDVARGAAALFALGIGMGLPLLLVGTLGARLLPRPGAWMERVKAFFGFVLLGTAITFAERVMPASLAVAAWGALALAAALALVALARTLAAGRAPLVAQLGAAICATWGVALLLGASAGAGDPLRPLGFLARAVPDAAAGDEARASVRMAGSPDELDRHLAAASAAGRWTLVDFSAEWCVSCKVIEREVLGEPRVASALAQMERVRVDVTAQDAAQRALMARHAILGPPTLLLIGPDGRERRPERVVGELGADEFLERLARARGST